MGWPKLCANSQTTPNIRWAQIYERLFSSTTQNDSWSFVVSEKRGWMQNTCAKVLGGISYVFFFWEKLASLFMSLYIMSTLLEFIMFPVPHMLHSAGGTAKLSKLLDFITSCQLYNVHSVFIYTQSRHNSCAIILFYAFIYSFSSIDTAKAVLIVSCHYYLANEDLKLWRGTLFLKSLSIKSPLQIIEIDFVWVLSYVKCPKIVQS